MLTFFPREEQNMKTTFKYNLTSGINHIIQSHGHYMPVHYSFFMNEQFPHTSREQY